MNQIMDRVVNFLNDDRIGKEIFLGIGICFVIWIVVYISATLYKKVSSNLNDNPVILSGLVDGHHAHEVKQDPNNDKSKILLRSINEKGIEYSYSTWIYINGETWSENNTKWRHVLHKGPRIQRIENNSEPDDFVPIQCPGLWINPRKNAMRLYVNTYDTNKEFVDIDNLPIRKWIHLVYTQSNFTSNIYINGHLKSSQTLSTLPRQNYYNLWITQDGGFDGYLSTTQYFNRVIEPATIYDLSTKGPNLKKHREKQRYESEYDSDLVNNSSYLSNRWWVNDVTYK